MFSGATPQSLLGCGVLCLKKIKKMTEKLKCFLERHNYKFTAVNTILIIIGISIEVFEIK